jgi:hypothetical protein
VETLDIDARPDMLSVAADVIECTFRTTAVNYFRDLLQAINKSDGSLWYFCFARSTQPVGWVERQRNPSSFAETMSSTRRRKRCSARLAVKKKPPPQIKFRR